MNEIVLIQLSLYTYTIRVVPRTLKKKKIQRCENSHNELTEASILLENLKPNFQQNTFASRYK